MALARTGAKVPPKSRGTAVLVRFHHPLTGQHQRRKHSRRACPRGGFSFKGCAGGGVDVHDIIVKAGR
jgi:hypothetical protein